jgi:2,4-dienoyl-CoA reductase-like NADH-dependent reductase (Old Yellow Enzyme family)
MAESMAPNNDPNDKFMKLYGEWADGGWGMILTGEYEEINHLSELY